MSEGKAKLRKTTSPAPPAISESEWTIMRVLWERGPLTTNQILEALADQEWKPQTVHTLLSRLTQKGAVRFERRGREYLFHPEVHADRCEHAAARSFLDRFFGG